MPVVSQSSENLNKEDASEPEKGNKKKKPVAPPRSKADGKHNGGIGGIKGSKSSFNLDPRPTSGRGSSSRSSSSRPGR